MLFEAYRTGKYKKSFLKRLGYDFPFINKGSKKLIWIHAVSVGEVKAIATLAKLLKESAESPILLVSSVTETGHMEAIKSLPFADYHVFLPFDFSFIIHPIVKKTQPNQVIISETDCWYNFLASAKRYGANIVLVNGKISEKSAKRFQFVKFYFKTLFSLFDVICVQSTHYLKRFIDLAIPIEKMLITGNIKLDDEYPKLSSEKEDLLREKLGISKGQHVIVLGSTHDPEERLLLESLKNVMIEYPDLKILLVPRHPERFNSVAEIVSQMQLRYHRYSDDKPNIDSSVILVDAMGLLRQCYQLASIAVVAGSFTPKIGGHNILEPLYYHVPVIFGPYLQNQPEMKGFMEEYSAGLQLNIEEVGREISQLLKNPNKKTRLVDAGNKMIEENKGASHITYKAIKNIDS